MYIKRSITSGRVLKKIKWIYDKFLTKQQFNKLVMLVLKVF